MTSSLKLLVAVTLLAAALCHVVGALAIEAKVGTDQPALGMMLGAD